MRTPLTDEQLSIEKTMPRSPFGQIVNPFYVSHLSWGPRYIAAFGEWCRQHPRSKWPDWLVEFVEHRRREAKKASGGVGGDGDGGGASEAGA